jgi:hypothetical protein
MSCAGCHPAHRPVETRRRWRDAVIARGETLQDAALEAFRLLMVHWGERPRNGAEAIDPAHPLIHLALAMVEDNKQAAAFLRDYDLKRLPESCGYTKDLDPKEVLQAGR